MVLQYADNSIIDKIKRLTIFTTYLLISLLFYLFRYYFTYFVIILLISLLFYLFSLMPSETYGTKDSPGHIAFWIISLGHQKDAVLQWLGKDELIEHKTVALAVKYIRAKLIESRSQSEARQDLDSKLTPIRYEEIRHTQAESFQRSQVNVPNN